MTDVTATCTDKKVPNYFQDCLNNNEGKQSRLKISVLVSVSANGHNASMINRQLNGNRHNFLQN